MTMPIPLACSRDCLIGTPPRRTPHGSNHIHPISRRGGPRPLLRPGAGGRGGGDDFGSALWQAAQRGVAEADRAAGPTEAATFYDPGLAGSPEAFDAPSFFAAAKAQYLDQRFGPAQLLYRGAIEQADTYGLSELLVITQEDAGAENSGGVEGVGGEGLGAARATAVCLYNEACCYCAFGELETAQQLLREAHGQGLNVKGLLARKGGPSVKGDSPLVPIVASVQVSKSHPHTRKRKRTHARSHAHAHAHTRTHRRRTAQFASMR